MGLFSKLFGGSSQKTQRTSTPVDVQASEFTSQRGLVADFLRQLIEGGQATQGDISVPGNLASAGSQLTAPLTSQQQSLINQIVGSAQSPLLSDAASALSATLSGAFLPGADQSNPFLDAAIEASQRSVTRNFEDVVVPQLLSRFTQRGQEVQDLGSSAFAREARLAGQGFQDTLADIASRLSFATFEGERERQLEAAGLAPGVSSAETDRLLNSLQAATLPQLVQDLGIQRGLELFNRQAEQVLQLLQIAGGITAPALGQQEQSTGKTSQSGGIIPGLASAFKSVFPAGLTLPDFGGGETEET